MLNDLARPTRLILAGFGVSIGLMLAGPLAHAPATGSLALLLAGLGVEVLLLAVFPMALGRTDRRFRARVVAAGADIAHGAVAPVPAVGRVVRRRAAALPWWMPGRGGGTGPAALVVLTAVGDGPPRRVAAVVPADLGLRGAGVPAELLVHPRHRDVAVVDDRVTPERLAAIDADPRWRSDRLPTDRSVVGGYPGLLVALVAGTAAGLGVGVLVVTLAT